MNPRPLMSSNVPLNNVQHCSKKVCICLFLMARCLGFVELSFVSADPVTSDVNLCKFPKCTRCVLAFYKQFPEKHTVRYSSAITRRKSTL